MTLTRNPLLIGEGLPPFADITPDHVVPAVEQLLQTLQQAQTQLEANLTPTWDGLMTPLTAIGEKLEWTWGVIGHLMGVQNSPELRTAYEQVQPELVKFGSQLSQNTTFYQGFKAIRESEQWATFTTAQKRAIEAELQSAELSGVGLTGKAKERFNAIQLELAELGTNFSNHVLDATKAFELKITDPAQVDGMPESWRSLAAQTACNKGETSATPDSGPWMVTLDAPNFGPFLRYCSARDLREQVYRAYVTRASSGELDNNPLITRILALRQEQAELLGFESYAQLSLARKMAPDVVSVETLLGELRDVSYPAAQKELADLKTFAQTNDLQLWDLSYWAERQRQAKFDLDAEALRPYFPLSQVLDGLFGLTQRLFGVEIIAADGQAPVWHEDVRYFQVNNAQGAAIAYFYLDPYSRPAEKRGGAWMDDCVGRAKFTVGDKTQVRLPVAYLTCNQMPPVADKPSLMSFGEVETLFHEFGHGLQHMLTQVDNPEVSGIRNVEWDAVELPSQFMENWCYERQTLFGMAKHYTTGETLPEAEYQKLLAARTYHSGLGMLRQLHFSFVDIELHHRYQPDGSETPQQVRDRLAQTTTVLPPLPDDSFLCTFGHIFAGGYAAGYYSYKWAEVLSADAFAAFEEVGLENESAIVSVGERFRDTVLALGGSQHPMAVFKAFRGREPDTAALLRHNGLVTA
ncbi:MAG: M3 family metallopeptidase [Spirulina sp. SIO3F2]|nr:M3 family metallopeptidase [Spirulina sp. SIO3F2]